MNPDTVEVWFRVARWFQYAGGFLVIGAAVQRWAVLPIADRTARDLGTFTLTLRNRAARWGMLGATLLVITAFARLYLQARSFLEPEDSVTLEFLHGLVTNGAWGRGWLLQLLAGALAGLAYFLAWLHGRLGWALVLVAASLVALAAPLTGHAMGSAAGRWGYPLDLVHFLAAASWIGTLFVLAASGLWSSFPSGGAVRHRLGAALVHGFSPVALVAGILAMSAGVFLAWKYIGGSIPALWTSRYGKTLLLKTASLAGVAAVGAYNWRVVRPRMGGPEGTSRVARASALELTFSVLLLVITAVLVALPMPGEE